MAERPPEGQEIGELFSDLGARIEAVQSIVEEAVQDGVGKRMWTVSFADESLLTIEEAADPSRWVFTIEVAPVREETRLEYFEALLAYNSLWKEHGGVRGAISSSDSEILLIYDWYIPLKTSAQLYDLVQSLIELRDRWRLYLAGHHMAHLESPTMQQIFNHA